MKPQVQLAVTKRPFYKEKWFKWLVIGIATLLVIIVAIAAIIYVVWLNSSQKALLDAADYAIENPGSYHVQALSTDLDVNIKSGEYEADGTLKGVRFDALLYSGTLYLKSPQLEQLYELLMGTKSGQALPSAISSIIPSIQNKWISVNLTNLPLQSSGAMTSECLTQTKDELAQNPGARKQLANDYFAHQFLDVSMSGQNDSTKTYNVSVNSAKKVDFVNSLKGAGFYQSFTDCSNNANADPLSKVPNGSASITLSNKHQLQSLVLNKNMKMPTTITADYSDVTMIPVPSDAIDTEQLLLKTLNLGNLESLLQ